MSVSPKEPFMSKKEGLIAGVLVILAAGVLFWSFELSKTNRLFDLFAKFAFAILVVVVARLVTLVFTYVDKEKEREKEEQLEVYRRIADLGIEDGRDRLSDHKLKDLLGKSRTIKVLKTWFPESSQIAEGLEEAITKGAEVKLLLCKPGSSLLMQRSLGAQREPWWGSFMVYHAVGIVYRCLLKRPAARAETPAAAVEIRCYDSWPGCPVIWYDQKILMGFYFRGRSSPSWPWVNVSRDKYLATILGEQFDELWNADDTERLTTLDDMKKWLEREDNKKWAELGVIPKTTES